MSLLLGIDIGTTGTKALLLDTEQGVVGEAERPTQLHSVHPGWAEEDTVEWWANVCAVTRELTTGADVVGVGVSGMVPCTILLDEHLRPLRRSIQQNDARTVREVEDLNSRLAGERILERTGSAITQQSTAPRFLWLAQHEPDVWERTRTVAGSYDYITMCLTGERFVESNWALETGLFDLAAGTWASDVLEACAARAELLPPIRRPQDVVGHVTADAARQTGLPEGVPVVAGTADHIGSTFAAGILDDGDLLVKLGGAGDIMLVVDEPLVDERLYLDFHLIPDRYVMSGCMATSGSLIKWFQREVAAGAALAELDAEAERVEPGSGGVILLPYFLGEKTPINDPEATGAFVGLRLTQGRGHLFRAVLEGIAFGFRHHLDVFEERGHPPRRVRVTDGGSRSRIWTQITADVLGLPLEKVTLRSGSAFAAAFAAGIGVGEFAEWRDVERFISVSEVVEPQPNPAYERNYEQYRACYPALREVLR
jgi:xylulokinase